MLWDHTPAPDLTYIDTFFNNVTHVFWDLDHTIWDFKTNARLTIFELYHKHALQTRINCDADRFHEVYIKHNNIAWAQYSQGKIDKESLRKQRFRNTFIELGTPSSMLFELFETEFVEICPTKTNLMPGAHDVLNAFNSKFKQHIITNGFKETQSKKIISSGIDHYFSSITNSEDAGFQKPHPMIFKTALAAANATIENSIMIGDNFDADVMGAYHLGMKCIYYNPDHYPSTSLPKEVICINHLSDLVR